MSRRVRISRSEVAWFVAGFLVLQGGLALALESFRPTWRDPEYGFKLAALKSQQSATADRPLLLFLGSSRVLNGIDPSRLSPPDQSVVYNFGLTRHGPVQQTLCLSRLLDEGIRPRWVVLEIAPHMMSAGGDGREIVPIERQRLGDLATLRKATGASHDVYLEWFEDRATVLSTSRHALLSEWLPNWVSWGSRQDFVRSRTGPDGWLPMPEPLTAEAAARARAEMIDLDGRQVHDFTLSAASERAVRVALDRCQKEQIRTAVVLMAEPTEFRALYTPHSEQQLQSFLAALRRDYGVTVFDGRGWVGDEGFRDPHHMNPTGAATFTNRLAEPLSRWVATP